MKTRHFIFLLFLFAFGFHETSFANIIAAGKTVKMHYQLTVDGEIIDVSQQSEPIEFIQGSPDIIPGLQEEIEGMKAGESKHITIPALKGYGEYDPEGLTEIPKSSLPEGELEIGMVLAAMTPEGNVLRAIVKEVHENAILVDFNHPLAGKELIFEVNIVEVL